MKSKLKTDRMLQTGILAGFTFTTGLLWGLDNSLDVILPVVFFAAIIFVAVNLLLQQPSSTPPKC